MTNLELLRKVGQQDNDVIVTVTQDLADLLSMQPCRRRVSKKTGNEIYISTLRWTDPEQGPKKCTIFGAAEGDMINLGDTIEFREGTGDYAGTYSGTIVHKIQ